MADVITMKDGQVQTLLEVSMFAQLIGEYMGYDSWRYFNSLIEKHNRIVADLEYARAETAKYVLETLLPHMPLRDDVFEEWVEDFRAEMEDLYGPEN